MRGRCTHSLAAKTGLFARRGLFLAALELQHRGSDDAPTRQRFRCADFDANYREAAESASRKIEAVLPETLRADIAYLQHSIRFMVCNVSDPLEMLQQLRRAILSQHSIRFCYHARISVDEQMDGQLRDVDPYALVHIGGKWQLVGYCHLRNDIRHFRLDRIED